MAVHKCVLKLIHNKVVPGWSKNSPKMKVGDTVRFTSQYGRVRLDFQEDCPFFAEKMSGGTVAFFIDDKAVLALKVKRVPRGKQFIFVCTSDSGPVKPWPANGGGPIPPNDPPDPT